MKRERDSQRSKVYRAEREHLFNSPLNRRLETMAELEQRVKEIVSSKFWAKHTPLNEPPRIKDGRGCRWARGSKWHIVMPKWARSEAVLIHELTHTLLYRKYPGHFGGKNYEYMAAHGWEFAELYLKMVRRFMGKEAHDILKASFKKYKVKFRAPRKKLELSPEEMERRREQGRKLAAARAAKLQEKKTRRVIAVEYY